MTVGCSPCCDLLSNEVLETQPFKFMRGYGQSDGVFSFETGRSSPGGVKTYFFRVLA